MPAPPPRDGRLVVDPSRVLAGPSAAVLLAARGARAVEVERPGTGADPRGDGPSPDGCPPPGPA